MMYNSKMKLVRKLVVVFSVCAVCTLPLKEVSANSPNAISVEQMRSDIGTNNIDNLEEIEENISMVYSEGDYTITVVRNEHTADMQNAYTLNEASIYATASVNAYKSAFYSDTCTITYKGVKLVRILLDAGFKYNGTYVYTSDGVCSLLNTYNGSKFTLKSENLTSKSNKSKTQAKYVANVRVKNSNYGGTSDFKFKIVCSPTGSTNLIGTVE